ncbi:MAG: hypothetical protein HY823_00475 [Acidobacteria bacterium]|nr:hypothetical protein [Acidobacteriota bacterium]
MSPFAASFLLSALGAGLVVQGLLKRRRGERHGPGEVLDAQAFARAGREQGNPLILVGAVLLAFPLLVWLLGR